MYLRYIPIDGDYTNLYPGKVWYAVLDIDDLVGVDAYEMNSNEEETASEQG